MPVYRSDGVVERGKADAKRHREKQKDAIKQNLPQVDESIITRKRSGVVKIRIKGIDIPDFRQGKKGNGIGVGQGDGRPGDVIGRVPGQKNGGKPGQAGSEPGEDYIEAEVPIEEYIEMVLEDCGLPRLQEKELKELINQIGWKIHGHTGTGPWALLDMRATAKEGMRRFWFLLRALEREAGKDELACFAALKAAKGIMSEALALLSDPSFTHAETAVVPFTLPTHDDLRFHKMQPDIEPTSQAVIIAMMDVSGSMNDDKKYLARSMLFWLVEFLRHMYKQVEVRFITHHTEARIVEEELFFKTMESGGTRCASAYELAGQLIDTEYPTNQWNVYIWHFSDGDDFDPDSTVEEIQKLFARNINMLGYGEIVPDGSLQYAMMGMGAVPGETALRKAMKASLKVSEVNEGGLTMLSGDTIPFLGVTIRNRSHLFPALKQFLKKDRWANAR